MDYFAGLDVSVKETSVCIVDDAGKIMREARVASEPEIAQITGNSDRAAGRVIGIREALAARGVALPQERLIECPHKITEGQLALRALMQSSKRPTAVICGTDVLAFGALIEARQLGVAVPRDLSIAGINDAEFAAHLTPPLTTMRLPADEIGTRAAEYLLGSVNSLPAASATQVQVSLIARQHCPAVGTFTKTTNFLVTSANAPCQRERLKSAHWGKLDSTRPFLLVSPSPTTTNPGNCAGPCYLNDVASNHEGSRECGSNANRTGHIPPSQTQQVG